MPTFAAVVNQAMETMQPRPAGLEAPDVLPPAPAAISAEATGLGGTYSVTLIATARPEPVNSPKVASAAADQASDLGSFSSIPTSSPAVAAQHVQVSLSTDLAPCSGPASSVAVNQAGSVTSCTTPQGLALNWHAGPWTVQVQAVGGTKPPTAAADAVATWLSSHHLPAATGGVISVSVPESAEAGSTTSAQVLWDQSNDVYEVTALHDEVQALDMAASMRPWPAG